MHGLNDIRDRFPGVSGEWARFDGPAGTQVVDVAIEAGADKLLLDNMALDMLVEAVALADGRIPLEASGGVTLETIRAIAETGVDTISVGAITQSAPAVDIGLDLAGD